MNNGLEDAYNLVVESQKEGTVKTNLKPGQAAAGELKKQKNAGPEATDVKKPTEGESKINPGYGKIKKESRELEDMLPSSKFDDLFKKQIVEEEESMSEESPVEMTGEGEFDEEEGDFPEASAGEDTTGEEVDVATELRMIVDRLTEVAERLGSFESDMEEAGEEVGAAEAEAEEAPELAPESVQADPVPMKDGKAALQAKNNKVKSAFKVTSGKAKTTGGPGSGDASGKLAPARKTTLGPKMSLKADVKGPMSKTGAGIFDNV